MNVIKQALALALSVYAVYVYTTAMNAIFNRDALSVIGKSFGGHLQFLTILSMYISVLHQLLSIIALSTGLRVFTALQSWVAMISAPLEVVVALMYWPLKKYKNNLVKDSRFNTVIDPYLDLKCHLFPAVLEVLSTTVFAQRRWTPRIVRPFLIVCVIAFGYWYWFEYTFKVNGFYPYPLLAVLDMRQKGIMISCAVAVSVIVYKIIQTVQKLFV